MIGTGNHGGDDATIRIDFMIGMADAGDGGIFLEGVHDSGKFLRRPPIVSVEESEDFAGCFGDASVESGNLAAVFLAKVTDPGKEGLNDLRRGIRRAVVDDDDFHLMRGESLVEDALERLGYEALVIVSVDDDGDDGHGSTHCRAERKEFQWRRSLRRMVANAGRNAWRKGCGSMFQTFCSIARFIANEKCVLITAGTHASATSLPIFSARSLLGAVRARSQRMTLRLSVTLTFASTLLFRTVVG